MKYSNKVYTVCYDRLDVFNNKSEAKDFYSDCYYMSEGAEHERYASILVDLNFSNIGKDNVSTYCREISVKQEDKIVNIRLDKALSIEDTINFYEEKVQAILEVSDDYGIDFNRMVPFDEFGSDEESDYMSSFSKYYQELFKKFNISVDNISTEEISDGKYNLVVDDTELTIKAGDKIESVIDNIDTMLEISKKKDLGFEV